MVNQVNLSQPYYSEYKFYDFDGNLIDTRQYQNVYSNGGGPMTDCNYVYQSYYNIIPKTDTEYNTLYLGAGPMNIDDFPSNTAQYTVQLFGNFTGSTLPPTPTPSPTPTPTTTPVICNGCSEILVENQSLSSGQFTFLDCDTRTRQTYTLPGGTGIQICACNDSINVYCACSENIYTYFGQIQIIVGPPCNQPTPTPTPTPSCLYRTFVIQQCFNTCTSGICVCSNAGTTTVYAPCSVTSPFADGALLYTNTSLTIPYEGIFSNGSVIYEAIVGTVSTVCVIGGPC